MTPREAIERLRDHFRVHDDGRPTPKLDEAVDMAYEALRLKEYIENMEYSSVWYEDEKSDYERGYNDCLKELRGEE